MKDKQDTNKTAKPKAPINQFDFKKFLWNRSTGEVLGRNAESWLKITIFYIVFYAALAGFFLFSYYLFDWAQIRQDKPKWLLEESLIGTNPGVNIRPLEYFGEKKDLNPLIPTITNVNISHWTIQLQEYVDKVEATQNTSSVETCSFENPTSATRSCKIDLTQFEPNCANSSSFGYVAGEPCILLKLNKIFDWKPEPFGINSEGQYDADLLSEDLSKYPEMPEDLRKHIEDGAKNESPASFLSTVWFSCEGKKDADKEKIGKIEYYPSRGIPSYYFPYEMQEGYENPFIFVKLFGLTRDVDIKIECRAWSRNNKYDKYFRVGFVQFIVRIETEAEKFAS